MTAIVFCFVVYFGGQMSAYWEHLGEHAGRRADANAQMSPMMQNLIKMVYFVLPRLDRFDVRARLIGQLPVEFNYMWKAFGSRHCLFRRAARHFLPDFQRPRILSASPRKEYSIWTEKSGAAHRWRRLSF